MLLVQFKDAQGRRHAGVLERDTIRIIDGYDSTYALAQAAIRSGGGLEQLAAASVGAATASFEQVADEAVKRRAYDQRAQMEEQTREAERRKSAEQAKARNMRNIVLGLSLVGFVILIFVVTVVKLGGNVGNRPL